MTYLVQELVDSSERDPSSDTTIDEVEALQSALLVQDDLPCPSDP